MNPYRFEISNRHENKFCSHDVSFRLHFKTTWYFDEHAFAFNFGYCLHDILSAETKFHLCQNDRNEITPTRSFKYTCPFSAISKEYALILFALGKFCSYENLMPSFWSFILKFHDRNDIHTGLSFISPQFMSTQVKSWQNTERDFQPNWNLIPVWVHFASHVNVLLYLPFSHSVYVFLLL